ncbi:hypothetical protein ANO11243_047180 [Dothideomycetidae sp. 11243]|nr:hypothetical protein ANO11243_047180 [fungal sp. No.11243]
MKGLSKQRMIYYVAGAVGVGWVSTEIAFFTACRPFSGYWAVPPPDPQCTTLQHYAIVQACFNIPTDLAMLSISIPLVMRLQVPFKQKVLVGLLFSMGIFVVVAAILTKVFNLSDVWSTSYMLWYTREASVATYVTNLPVVWPLVRHLFPFLRGASSQGKSSGKNYHYGYATGGNNTRARTGNNTIVDAIDMDTRALNLEDQSYSPTKDGENGINVLTTVEVTKESEHF